MNLRDLKYLVTVADLKHFGRAAQTCFVSQPTLSVQLKKLEEELGVVVFERDNKSVMLTNAGAAIVEQARVVLREAQHLKEIAKRSQDPLAGPLRIGFIPTLGPYLLPLITIPLVNQYPNCEFTFIEEKTENLIHSLRDGDIDAIVLALPIEGTSFTTYPLFHEEFLVALPKQHPLANQKQIEASQLRNQPLLLLQEGHCLRDQALAICHEVDLSESDFRATSLETLRHMVIAGRGITLLPQLALKNGDTTLATVKFNPAQHREIGMMWRKNTPRKTCCEMIAASISNEMKKYL